MFGVILQIVGLSSLNRSFAIVAALRQIKMGGLYRIVRHPMYSSYIISFIGYLLFNATLLNFALLFLSSIFFFFRIEEEEKQLISDPLYVAYKERVRFRLIPLIY